MHTRNPPKQRRLEAGLHARRAITVAFLLLILLLPVLTFSCYRVSPSWHSSTSSSSGAPYTVTRGKQFFFDSAGKPISTVTPVSGADERDTFYEGVRTDQGSVEFATGAVWTDWISTGIITSTNVGKGIRPQASYVILFRHPPLEKLTAPANVNITPMSIYFDHSVSIDSQTLHCEYVGTTTANNGPLQSETLTLNSISYPLSAGRVFLADFRSSRVAIEHLNIDIPTPPDSRTDEWLKLYYKELLEELKSSSPRVEAFLK
ncbi:MAG: hypothetical protein ACKVS6_02745 [Planctomycetota bacterium]